MLYCTLLLLFVACRLLEIICGLLRVLSCGDCVLLVLVALLFARGIVLLVVLSRVCGVYGLLCIMD